MAEFEIFAVAFSLDALVAGLSPLVRFVAVVVPVLMLTPARSFSNGVIPITTWGGLKGGISATLTLSLPDIDCKTLILKETYLVVIFSIIVQGLSVAPLARRVGREPGLM